MGLLTDLTDLIKEFTERLGLTDERFKKIEEENQEFYLKGLITELRERLELADKSFKKVEEENRELKKCIAILEDGITKLRTQVRNKRRRQNMHYWLTIHNPPRRDKEELPGVFLRDNHKKMGEALRRDDLVIVYETKGGKTIKNAQRLPGHMGVVHYGIIIKALYERFDPEEYTENFSDGTSRLWKWFAPIEVISRSGFLSCQELALCLGYDEKYNFHGYPRGSGSGFGEIDQGQYENIVRKFHAGTQR